MHIDIVPTERWEVLGDEIKKNFAGALYPASSEVKLRSYKSAGHAAYEAAQTLLQIYSHKRAVAYIKGVSPVFEFLVPQFLRDAFQVQSTDVAALTNPQAWVDQLKKETNFALVVEDHPITGEVYAVDELDRLLNEKRIFVIRASHARHFQVCEEVRPYSARILSFGPDLAVTVFGQKFKAQGLTAPQMGWDKQGILQKIQRKRKRVFDQKLVEEFENTLSPWKFFQEKVNRIYDRAVLVFPDVNADSVVTELAAALSLNKNTIQDLVATTSQCSWEAPVSFKGWWQPEPTPETVRGLIVFSGELLARKDFANLVKSSYDKVIGLQESFK